MLRFGVQIDAHEDFLSEYESDPDGCGLNIPTFSVGISFDLHDKADIQIGSQVISHGLVIFQPNYLISPRNIMEF